MRKQKHQIFTDWLQYYSFFKKKKKSNVYQHQATLFFSFKNFSGRKKWDNSIFSHASFLSILKSEAGFRAKASWEAVAAWALCPGPGDASASVPETVLHICQWTRRASPWWQGWRCCCTQLWKNGDPCLVWGLMKGADSPQGVRTGEVSIPTG